MQELGKIFVELCRGLTDDQRRALTPGQSVSVRAVAGAGKTHVLSLRYIQHLLTIDPIAGRPLTPHQIAAITFTRKAAGELRSRIDAALGRAERAAESPDAQSHIVKCREQILDASIGTIHSFCSSLLREFALDADVDPDFAALDESEADALLESIMQQYWDDLSLRPASNRERRDAVELLSFLHGGRARELIETLVRDFNLYIFSRATWFRENGKNSSAAPITIRDCIDRSIVQWVATEKPSSQVATAARFIGWTFKSDEAEQYGAHLAQIATRAALAIWDRYDAALDEKAALDFNALERRAWQLVNSNGGRVLNTLRRRYRRIMMDEFQDTSPVQWELMRLIAGDAIADTAGEFHLAPGSFFIVGDPQQSIYGFREADLRLFGDAEKLIQKSDDDFSGLVNMADNFRSRPEIIRFTNIVMPAVQEVCFKRGGVDAAAPESSAAKLLGEFKVNHLPITARAPKGARGSVRLLFAGRKMQGRRTLDTPDEVDAKLIAHAISKLATPQSGIKVTRKDADGKIFTDDPKWSDIAVLSRTRSCFKEIENALKSRGIPSYISGSRGYFQTPEITDASNLLTFLCDPDQNVSLVGILRSPMFSFPDTLLFRIALNTREISNWWEKLKKYNQLLKDGCALEAAPEIESADEEKQLVLRAVDHLERWFTNISNSPLHIFLNEVMEECALWAAYREGDRQDQVVANLEKLLDLAREFAVANTGTLLEFSEHIAELAREEEREAEAATESEQANVVRIMTIHAAKGLEFPIVFVPRLMLEHNKGFPAWAMTPEMGPAFRCIEKEKRNDPTPPSIYNSIVAQKKYKSLLEELRLLYVVLTRAMDHLYICTSWFKGKAPDVNAGPHGTLLGIMMQTPVFSAVRETIIRARDEKVVHEVHKIPIEDDFEIDVQWFRDIDIFDTTNEREAEEAKRVKDEGRNEKISGDFFALDRLAGLVEPKLPHGEIHSSVSQLALLSACPRQYAYYRLLGPVIETQQWEGENPKPEEEDRFAATDENEGEDSEKKTTGGANEERRLYGLVCHKLFELYLLTPESKPDTLISEAFDRAAPEVETSVQKDWADDLLKNLASFRSSQIGRSMLDSPERYPELPFQLNPNVSGQVLIVSGIIDCLYRDGDGHWALVDYKTSRIVPENVSHSASRYVPQMALNAAFVMARFPEQESVKATLYYPFPDAAVPMNFKRDELLGDLSEAAASWVEILSSKDLEAFPFAFDWLKKPCLDRTFQHLLGNKNLAISPPSEPCPVCPFFEQHCPLPDDVRHVMLARRKTRMKK